MHPSLVVLRQVWPQKPEAAYYQEQQIIQQLSIRAAAAIYGHRRRLGPDGAPSNSSCPRTASKCS